MDNRLLLLGLLRQHRRHGYELAAFIDGQMNTCTDMKKPTAYFLLDKMTSEGWVTTQEEREGNRPIRRVYSLTPKGEAAYAQLLRENLAEYAPSIFTGDIGLAFLDELPAAEAGVLLGQRRAALAQKLAHSLSAPAHGGSIQLLLDHQIHHLSSELAWLDGLMAKLQASASTQAIADSEGNKK
jgi:DNA-binding PadR family transcriptional regulator